jgi:hypothetical protein
LGEAPIITEPIKGQLSIILDYPEKAMIFRLDDLGSRMETIESKVIGGKLVFNLPGTYGSRMFEIVVH